MFVAVLFIPVVAGNFFLESDFRRLPKITERRNPQEKSYMLFDPCKMEEDKERSFNCAELRRHGENVTFQYPFKLHEEVRVKCDMDTLGGGWTVIQRRGRFENEDDKKFREIEADYDNEFGDPSTSYWIGNKNLHLLTAFPRNKQVLLVQLWTKDNKNISVMYDNFEVGSEAEKYKLSIGKYKGLDAGAGYDALSSHDGAPFTTTKSGSGRYNCYRRQSGGWWFGDQTCGQSNLNGRTLHGSNGKNLNAYRITWRNSNDPTSYTDRYLAVEMKIRDADFEFCMGSLTYRVL